MERSPLPDLVAAARHLENARTALAEAVRAINRDEAAPLLEIGKGLGEMTRLMREGMLIASLRVPLVSASNGGRALGRSKSPKKLEALGRAREKLAKKRRDAWEQRHGRKYVPPKPMELV